MNTGQSLLTLGALIMVSIISLNFYRANNEISSSLDFDRFRVEGMAILTSQVEQLSQYYFDEITTDTTSSKRLIDMTSPYSLGLEANDSGRVDDIDDLRGMVVVETGLSGVSYRVLTDVEYVTLSNDQFVFSGSRQYHKRVRVSVYDGYNIPLIYHIVGEDRVKDTLKMSVTISYWFYN